MPVPHAAGDPGWIAWTNSVDTNVAGNTADLAGRLSAATLTAAFVAKGSLVYNVKDYGALGNDSADDSPAIQAAINAASAALNGGLVFIPAGIYRTTATLTVTTARVRIEGAGRHNTTLKQTTATNNVLTVSAAATYFGLSELWMTRSVTATSGNGLDLGLDGQVTYANIHDVYVTDQWRGMRLGPTNYSYLRDCGIGACQSDGLYFTNSTTSGTLQWQINTLMCLTNGGVGVRVSAQNIGPTSITMGNWSGLSTWANTSFGVSIEGLAAVPINGVRIQNSFFGEDGNSEVYLNSYAGMHVFSNVFCELAGSGPTGPTSSVPASGIGYGLEVTPNNTEVTVSGGQYRGNSQSGIITRATFAQITGIWATSNGQNAMVGPLHNSGISVAAGDAQVTGCNLRGSEWGLYTYVDSVAWVGNRLAGSTAAYDNAVPLINSVVRSNAGGPVAWTAYTPVLTGATTNPNIGTTGTIVGSYMKTERTVHWKVLIQTGGTGIAAGSGNYLLTLPVPPISAAFILTGWGWVYGATGFKTFVSDGTPSRFILSGSSAFLTNTDGFTAAGQVLVVTGTYESAT